MTVADKQNAYELLDRVPDEQLTTSILANWEQALRGLLARDGVALPHVF